MVRTFLLFAAFGCVLVFAACARDRPLYGSQIGIRWKGVENDGHLARQELTLINRGQAALGSEGWNLYFNLAYLVVPESVPPSIRITHVHGDFYQLAPTTEFVPLGPGEERTVPFAARGSIINESAAPSGFYFVLSRQGGEEDPEIPSQVEIEPFLTPEQTNRGPGDEVPVPTPESRFRANQKLALLPAEEVPKIVPTPLRFQQGSGTIRLDSSFSIHHEQGLAGEAQHLAESLELLLGSRLSIETDAATGARTIRLATGPVTVAGRTRRAGDEAYRLEVDGQSGIEIVATDPAGVFYGIQSLRALIPPEAYRKAQESVPVVEAVVEDAPRFGYRGMHLDVARNFQSKETVKKLLDVMAFYKLNRFHFHLTDDEGWRLEILKLPELTRVGGRRGHTTDERDHLIPSWGSGPYPDPARSPGSGYYTREDFIQILHHATRRHIEVIPEIDVPGHARAAIRAMDARRLNLLERGREEEAREFLLRDLEDRSTYRSIQGFNDNVVNVCQESTYRFLETVLGEIAEMYREAGTPLRAVHIGGDEVPHGVWESSPACRRLIEAPDNRVESAGDLAGYFLLRVADLLAAKGLVVAGWEEIGLRPAPGPGEGTKVPNPAFVDRNFRVHAWDSVWGWGGEENAYRLANAGYKVVLSNASNLYFDLAYEKDPKEPGLHWAGFVDARKAWEFTPMDLYLCAREDLMGRPLRQADFRDSLRLTETGKNNVLGIQGQLWGENARGQELMEYLALPKLLGLAERAWSRADWEEIQDSEPRQREQEAAWNRFANSLGQRELPRLDFLQGGFHYRLPPPGAVLEEGTLKANGPFPGLTIRYTTDGSEPTRSSPAYAEPVPAGDAVRLRTFDGRGRGSRTVEVHASRR